MVGSQSIQDITQRIDRAYKLFFRNRKQNIRSAPPSFKKVRKYKSFTLKQAGYKLLADNRIIILGQEYKFHKSRDIEGTVKTLTVKRDPLGDIYIYLVCKQESNQVIARTGKSVGFDFGLKKFLVSSDGSDIEAPMFFKQNADVIKTANRRLSRKKKGSNNRERARLELTRLHKMHKPIVVYGQMGTFSNLPLVVFFCNKSLIFTPRLIGHSHFKFPFF
jgi:putative transposase